MLLAIYTLVPVADIVACADCCLPALAHMEIKVSSTGCKLDGLASSAIHSDASKDASATDSGVYVHCPLCSNSVLSYCSSHDYTRLIAFSTANPFVLSAYRDPAFSITKPPQN
jgi:hypothetical protein